MKYRCGPCPVGGDAPTYPANPPSLRSWTAPPGRFVLSLSPAPLGSSVTEAGTLATDQCQKPLPVGASGSYTVTAKLFVPSGKPDHDSCGERSSPPGTPTTAEGGGAASVLPPPMSPPVSVNVGPSGERK